MSDYDAIECPLCGYYYMRHHGACPNCYPEQASNTTSGEYVAIAYPKEQKALENNEAIIVKAQKRLYLRFFVPSNPIPKARPRTGKGHAYTPKRTKNYEALVKQWASIAIAKQNYTMPHKDTSLLLIIHFYRDDKRGADLDNLQKAIWDALNKLAYPDDKQIEAVIATVTRGGNYEAGAMVTIAEYYPDLSILENLDCLPK